MTGNTAPRILAITCSTRPKRVGHMIATWFAAACAEAGRSVELVDLREFALPLYDEPQHPRTGQYTHPHTRRWADAVSRADAFVFVMPEYNHAPPSSLVNALTFLSAEWKYKPVAFVSYGGLSGGLRAVQAAKTMLLALRMVPIVEAVSIHDLATRFDAIGAFQPSRAHVDAVPPMLAELSRLAEALAALRPPVAGPLP